MGILDSDLRKRLLQMPVFTINMCIDMCRAYEATKNGMRYMEGTAQYQTFTLSCILDEREDERSSTP